MSARARARRLSAELGLANARVALAERLVENAQARAAQATDDDTGYRTGAVIDLDEAEHELATARARVEELLAQGAHLDPGPPPEGVVDLAERRRRRDVDD